MSDFSIARQPLYPEPIETAIARLEARLTGLDPDLGAALLSGRGAAILLLQGDRDLQARLRERWIGVAGRAEAEALQAEVTATVAELRDRLGGQSPAVAMAEARQQLAWSLEQEALAGTPRDRLLWSERLHRLAVNPWTGFPLAIAILYFGVYQFVGGFGAGVLVDAIEGNFESVLNPAIDRWTAAIVPWPVLQDLIANDYGLLTLGLRYAVAIVLPIVATFFLMFSLLEDSGYLPRLSLMLDRVLKTIGLSGRAVIPLVLGFGCDTMATVTTRTLETRRERAIAIFLLALTIPCAAQWGAILGLLAQKPAALAVWAGAIAAIFLVAGHLLSRCLPGRPAGFYMEIPPLRLPHLRNVLLKTAVRVKWYFLEILPAFLWASVAIWAGRLTGIFDAIVGALEPVVRGMGLPVETAPVFLYGFFRRDYGAAGLFDIQRDGALSGNQLAIAAIVLTLFVPCIAQFQVMLKEQGTKTTLAMVAFIFAFAFAAGYATNGVLNGLGVQL